MIGKPSLASPEFSPSNTAPRFGSGGLHPLVIATLLLFAGNVAAEAIVTPPPLDVDAPTGGFPPPTYQAVTNCPATAFSLPTLCLVDKVAAGVLPPGVPAPPDSTGGFESVRIGRTGETYSSLSIGKGASLTIQTDTPAFNPGSRSVIVGDNFNTAASLSVRGNLTIVEPNNGNGSGGLIVGAFVAPTNPQALGFQPGTPTTVLSISRGGIVDVQKPGGFGVASAIASGYGVGSNSSIVLDGGINGFGSAAEGATMTTSGNLSIGRQGTGSVNLIREATVSAQYVFMSTIASTGQSSLGIGYHSTLNGNVFAGIGLDASGHPDPNVTAHGTANIFVDTFGVLNGGVVLGSGGHLGGFGTVGSITNLGGTVGPGHSPGTLTITGDYVQTGGILEIEIASATDFDVLKVGGNSSITDALIDFKFINGFAPTAGFDFDFLNLTGGGTSSLTNVTYQYSGLQPGFLFDVVEGPNGLTFVAQSDGTVVPEPPTWAIFSLGLAALFGWRGKSRTTCEKVCKPFTPA